MLTSKIKEIQKEFSADLSNVKTAENLEKLRLKYLSRNGIIPALFNEFKSLPKDQKPQAGKLLNILRNKIEDAFYFAANEENC